MWGVGLIRVSRLGRLVEQFRLTHTPLPPSSVRVVFDDRLGPSCDIDTLTIYLRPRDDSDVLEFDFRHEIEHILHNPRDVGRRFKVFYYGLRRLYGEDRELWKSCFHEFHNAACDIIVNHRVAKLYPGARRGMEKVLRRIRALDPLTRIVVEAAQEALMGRWLRGLPRGEEELTFELFKRYKDYYRRRQGQRGQGQGQSGARGAGGGGGGGQRQQGQRRGQGQGQGEQGEREEGEGAGVPRRDVRAKFDLRRVAMAAAELVEEGEDMDVVVEAIVAFSEACREEEARRAVEEALEERAGGGGVGPGAGSAPVTKSVARAAVEEAYVWKLFDWSWKLTDSVKVSVRGVRPVYDTWRPGEPVEELLITETLRTYGKIIPGHNTLKLRSVKWEKWTPKLEKGGANVAILLDASGSMGYYGRRPERAARDATISLIGACAKRKYPVRVIAFSGGVDWYTGWREDHFALALEVMSRYRAGGSTTVRKALEKLLEDPRENMTIYLISDMDISDVQQPVVQRLWRELSRYDPRVVVFLISHYSGRAERVAEVLRRAGVRDVVGYSLSPFEYEKLRERAVRELPLR